MNKKYKLFGAILAVFVASVTVAVVFSVTIFIMSLITLIKGD